MRRPDDPNPDPDPPGGRAAERLKEFLRQRGIPDPSSPAPDEEKDEKERKKTDQDDSAAGCQKP